MKSFYRPDQSWLQDELFQQLVREHDKHGQTVEQGGFTADALTYMTAQNQVMLLKFFLEQAFGSGEPFGKTLRIIQRDFGSVEQFAAAWRVEAVKDGVEWLVFGLSFADFRFHIFPIHLNRMPFCISPMMSACLREEVIARSGLTRQTFVEVQWTHIDWRVVEQRIACLGQPLDVLADAQDCLEGVCDSGTAENG